MNRKITLLLSLLILAFCFQSKGQAPITGNTTLCTSATTQLSSTDAGGTWTSSNTTVATIDLLGPTVYPTGPTAAGVTVITYGSSAGVVTATVTVGTGPIAGPATVCEGDIITLSTGTPNGTWSSGTTTVATVDVSTGKVTGVSGGTVIISYNNICGVAEYPITVIPVTQPITGPTTVCTGNVIRLSDPTAGGTWSSGTTTVATVTGSGVVTAVTPGVVVISYSNGCGIATHTITVNGSPGPITGLNSFCQGSIATLGSSPGGGTWSSSNTTVVTVNVSSGGITASSVGNAYITYTVPNGCFSVYAVVVNNCPACPPNSDFELGNYSYWQYFTGTCCPGPASAPLPNSIVATTPFPIPPFPTGGFTAGSTGCRFALCGPAGSPAPVLITGNDPIGGFPVVGAGYYSLRIGSGRTSAQAEKAVYYVHVPTGLTNYSLIYQYAVVLENPNHSPSDQPRFTVVAYDSATNTKLPCANFTYVPPTGTGAGIPGFVNGTGNANCSNHGQSLQYKPWGTASINLSGLGGTTIRMEFAAGGCQPTGHYAYGYVDMTCGTFAISSLACGDSIATVTAPSGFANYSWYDSSTFTTLYGTTQTITFPTPSVPTTYAVILTPYTGFGCPDTLYTRIRPSNLQLHPKPDTLICAGQTATISSNATDIALPLTYQWTPTTGLSCATCASPNVTPFAGVNVYTVLVTDDAGCSKSTTQKVTADSAAITTSSTPTSCFGYSDGTVSVVPSLGISPYTYVWSTVPAQTTTTATGLAIGLYSVTATDSLGCKASGTATVTQPPVLTMSIGGTTNPTNCGGAEGSITLNGLVATTSYTVRYLDGTTAVTTTSVTSGTGTFLISGLAAGTYDSISIVTTGCPYNILGPITLTDPAPPALPFVSSNSPVCDGQDLHLTSTDITPGVSFSWAGPNGFTSATQTATITPVQLVDSGWYVVTVTKNNCTSVDSTKVRVIVNPNPQASNNSAICSGSDTLKLTSVNLDPATGADAFIWYGPNGFTSNFQNPIIPNVPMTAIGTYTVLVTRNGCTTQATTDVTINETPPSPVVHDTDYCQFATAIPVQVDGTNIRWYLNPTGDKNDTLVAVPPTPNTATPNIMTWYVTQTSNTTPACTSVRGPVTVGVYAVPDPKFVISDSVFCEGTYFTFQVTGENTGVDYQGLTWSFGPNDSVRNVNPVLHAFSGSPTGTAHDVDVTVNVNYAVCPDATLKHTVTVVPYPSLHLGADTSICPGSQQLILEDKENEGVTGARWIWNTGETTRQINVVAPGTFYVKVTVGGCSTSDTILVNNDCYMNMPNVFTPNGDGVNDYFFPRQYLTRGLTSFKMEIYNRWGQIVFESKSLDGRGWDGRFNDVPQPEGVFIYVVDATFKDGQKEHHQGNLTLLR